MIVPAAAAAPVRPAAPTARGTETLSVVWRDRASWVLGRELRASVTWDLADPTRDALRSETKWFPNVDFFGKDILRWKAQATGARPLTDSLHALARAALAEGAFTRKGSPFPAAVGDVYVGYTSTRGVVDWVGFRAGEPLPASIQQVIDGARALHNALTRARTPRTELCVDSWLR